MGVYKVVGGGLSCDLSRVECLFDDVFCLCWLLSFVGKVCF